MSTFERAQAPGSEATGPRCVQCTGPVEGARCDDCGAAQRAGDFVIERVLAQSPRGRMYLARGKDGRKVALKELIFVHAPGAEAVDAFEREGRVLGTLSHPRIPRFVGAFQEGRGVHLRLYLAQEFVEGPNAAQRASTARFTEDEALQRADELLEVLEYLHALSPRVVHRDVKPANLVLRPDGGLMLVDFDAARDLGRDVTHRSTLVGTTGYMAPEQYGGTVSPASDLFAVGATLLHLLSGEAPPIPRPGQPLAQGLKLNVSPGTRAVLERLTEWTAERRYASATEARRALAEARERGRTSRAAAAEPPQASAAVSTPRRTLKADVVTFVPPAPPSPSPPPRPPTRRELRRARFAQQRAAAADRKAGTGPVVGDLPAGGPTHGTAPAPPAEAAPGVETQAAPDTALEDWGPGAGTVIINGEVVKDGRVLSPSQLGRYRSEPGPRAREIPFPIMTLLIAVALVWFLLMTAR